MGRKVNFKRNAKSYSGLDHDNDYQGATIQVNVSYQEACLLMGSQIP